MKNLSDFFIELAPDTFHSVTQLKQYDAAEVSRFKGFRSVYLYPAEAVRHMIEKGAVRGINQFPVYSDTLFVDFDDGDASIEKMIKILESAGVAYEMFFSGSKGYHFHVPIKPMFGTNVPYSQKQFILGLGISSADTSIYKHTGLFRLPGTWHQVTGNPKESIRKNPGKELTIPLVQPSVRVSEVVSGSAAELVAGFNRAIDFTLAEPGPGARHNSLLSIAKHLLSAGASVNTVQEICQLVHENWEQKYESEEKVYEAVERAVQWINVGD